MVSRPDPIGAHAWLGLGKSHPTGGPIPQYARFGGPIADPYRAACTHGAERSIKSFFDPPGDSFLFIVSLSIVSTGSRRETRPWPADDTTVISSR